MLKSKITNEVLLDMLGVVLVEIRAGDIPRYTEKMSDVFHNVPSKLITNVPPNEIYEDMIRVAKRHSVENYLVNLLEHSSAKFLCQNEIGLKAEK